MAAEEDGGPFAPLVLWMMSWDRDTNIAVERGFFAAAALLTVLSLKTNWDKWQEDKAEKEEMQKEAVRNAIDPDREMRMQASKKGFADGAIKKSRVRGKPRTKTPTQEVFDLESSR